MQTHKYKDWIQIIIEEKVLQEIQPIITEEIKCGPCLMPFDINRRIDLVVTIGGDGTILWATKLFGLQDIPPILDISKGTLGFMCNYDIDKTFLQL